jgi:hypothetical protein
MGEERRLVDNMSQDERDKVNESKEIGWNRAAKLGR